MAFVFLAKQGNLSFIAEHMSMTPFAENFFCWTEKMVIEKEEGDRFWRGQEENMVTRFFSHGLLFWAGNTHVCCWMRFTDDLHLLCSSSNEFLLCLFSSLPPTRKRLLVHSSFKDD